MKTSFLSLGRLFLFVAILSLSANFDASGSEPFGRGNDSARLNVGKTERWAAAVSRNANFVAFTFHDLFDIFRGKRPPPKANPGGPYNGISGTALTFNGSLSPQVAAGLSFSWDFGDGATANGPSPSHTYKTAGTFTVTLTVKYIVGGSGFVGSTTAAISSSQNVWPIANAGGPYSGAVGQSLVFNGLGSTDPDHDPLTFAWDFGDGQKGIGATPGHTYATSGTFTVTLTVDDGRAGTNTATTNVVVSPPVAGAPTPPPDPASIAPALSRTTTTSFYDATQFLYNGTNAIQTGVLAGTIDASRAAVLRGTIRLSDGTPLPTVKVSVLGHTEFGQTLSRADGAFDLAVNGGAQLTVRYEKAGFPPVQRAISAPLRDYGLLPEIVMIPLDNTVTQVDLNGHGGTMQVVRGSKVTDADGTRQATILFPQGTTATSTNSTGLTLAVPVGHIRATEYTVGDSGPKAMPGLLPPTSLYTYAAELSVDEAVDTAGNPVQVNFYQSDGVTPQTLPVYVENFLNMPVGTVVPMGYYDRQKGQWIASDNGRVIKVLSITGTMADLDTDGSGAAATAATLTALKITPEERSQLAQLYTAGQELWRMPVTHFSSFDGNFNGEPPPGADFPPGQGNPPAVDNPNTACGSIIGIEDQTLGEVVPVSGTRWGLHYTSGRTPGKRDTYTINIPVSGPSPLPSPSPVNMRVKVNIAGRQYQLSSAPAPNVSKTVTWDGRDIYGRQVQGIQNAVVEVDYDYVPIYYAESGRTATNVMASWAQPFGIGILATPQRVNGFYTFAKAWTEPMGNWDARASGLGGWTLNVHHAYDPFSDTLLLGDGRQRSSQSMLGLVITTIAGIGGSPGYSGPSGDFGLATLAHLDGPCGVALSPDGNIYIADTANNCVRRVAPDGTITRVVGPTPPTGIGVSPPGFNGDGIPANTAQLSGPMGVAVGPDGSLYIADTGDSRVRRVGPDMMITTVAGTNTAGKNGDGGPAIAAQLRSPQGVAIGPDGSVYIADSGNNKVRRVGPDGTITTAAGTGINTFNGDGIAVQVPLNQPDGVAVGLDGSVYIADTQNDRVRRVAPNGIITTLVGTTQGSTGDGGPGTVAKLNRPRAVTIGRDGSVYIADTGNYRVRRVGPDGIITTIAGTTPGFSGDGGLAANAKLTNPIGMALSPDGNLYIADSGTSCVRRLGSALPGVSAGNIVVPSDDGREVYKFDSSGRHLSTLNALTGATLVQFDYDGTEPKRLHTVTEKTNGTDNVTTINHDAAGNPTIVAPFGQNTKLTVDSNGYLNKITNPAGESVQLVSTSDGLLTQFKDPKGNASLMFYDALGRLQYEQDAAFNAKSLWRTDAPQSYTVNIAAESGVTTTYQVQVCGPNAHPPCASTGVSNGVQRTVTFPDNTQTQVTLGTDGSQNTTFADGTVTQLLEGPDPRFGMQAPLITSASTTTGSLTSTITATRNATLTDPTNLLSLTNLTDSVTLNGRVFTSVYDATTNTTTITSPEHRITGITTDSLGRTVQLQPPGLLPVNLTYDSRGRLGTISQGSGPGQRTATLGYNTDGYSGTRTDPLLQTTTFLYDGAGRVRKATLADHREIAYEYDANGNLTSITPPGRQPHVFTYTPVNLVHTYTPPDVGTGAKQTVYDYFEKRVRLITRPDGKWAQFVYDVAGGCNCGRLKELDLPTGVRTFDYYPTGKLKSIADPNNGTISYTYNGAMLDQTTWSGPVTGYVNRVYNNNFYLDSLSVDGANPPISFQYDNDGLIKQAGLLGVNTQIVGGLWRRTTSLGNVTDTLNYNGFGEVHDYTANYNGTSMLKIVFDERDALGRIKSKTESINGVTTTFGYDYYPTGELQDVKTNGTVTTTFTYDSNGNRMTGPWLTTAPPIYDAQDRLTQYGATTYSYTDNGELQTKSNSAGLTQYVYDALGNLIQVQLPSGDMIDYIIDGQNRRIGKKKNGSLQQGFLYQDRLKPIAELDGANNVVSQFVYATHVNVPDYMIKGTHTYRIITDHLGSPRLVVDITVVPMVIAQQMNYDEFGNVSNDSNPGFQPFGFAGGLYDPDTKLVRFRVRDYDAETGRWTCKDPATFKRGGTNLYAYALNDPLNTTDAGGLGPWDKTYGLPKDFWNWFHRQPGFDDLKGPNGQIEQEVAEEFYEEWLAAGKPGPDKKGNKADQCGPDAPDAGQDSDPESEPEDLVNPERVLSPLSDDPLTTLGIVDEILEVLEIIIIGLGELSGA